MRVKILHALMFGILAVVIAAILWQAGLLERWEYATWSWRVKWFARPGPHTDSIKLILLDQSSLDWGKEANSLSWPWPREVYVPILDFCRRGGARCVAFDVLYTEPSAYGVMDDQAMGQAIQDTDAFISAVFLGVQSGDAAHWPAFLPDSKLKINGLDAWLNAHPASGLVMPRAAFPIPEVATNAGVLANVRGDPDADSVIRRTALFRVFDGQAVPSLGLAPLCFLYGREQILHGTLNNKSLRLEFSDRPVQAFDGRPGNGPVMPIDADGRAILRYRGTTEVYDTFSAAAVIQSELRLQSGGEPTVDPAIFSNAWVFLGFSAPGLMDLRPTPVSSVSPGVMVYATQLDNLLTGDLIREAPPTVACGLCLLLALACSFGVILPRRVWQSVTAGIVVLVGAAGIAFYAYSWNWWYPLVFQTGAVALAFVVCLIFNYATEGRQKTFIKKAFRHYLSPDVIDMLLRHPEQLTLGGERRELTILFSDLKGFSAISEKLDPRALTRLLNDYLTDMTDIILAEGGTLDKYEGDAIMAFWNAPLTQTDHGRRACRAALRCQRRLAERRAEFEQRTGVGLYARTGLNTGEVVVGNMGSANRFDYTVLGDAANLASRLEGANKAFGTWNMVSETTWAQAREYFQGRLLGRIRVVGRAAPVCVYELLAEHDEPVELDISAFEEAVRRCVEGRARQALEQFRQWPDDPVAQRYIALIESLQGASWDGIWNLQQK